MTVEAASPVAVGGRAGQHWGRHRIDARLVQMRRQRRPGLPSRGDAAVHGNGNRPEGAPRPRRSDERGGRGGQGGNAHRQIRAGGWVPGAETAAFRTPDEWGVLPRLIAMWGVLPRLIAMWGRIPLSMNAISAMIANAGGK
jgi:hypothetical protein